MAAPSQVHSIREFLGSVHIFSSAVSELLQERLQEITQGQVTFSQLKLLKLIAHTEDAYSISEVASFLGVSNAAASKAVDRLVRRGLLQRTVFESDRRSVRVTITKAGFAVLSAYDAATGRALGGVFHDFPDEHLKKTAELLDRLSVSLIDRDSVKEESCFRCGIYFRDRCLLRATGGRTCRLQRQRAGAATGDARKEIKRGGKREVDRKKS